RQRWFARHHERDHSERNRDQPAEQRDVVAIVARDQVAVLEHRARRADVDEERHDRRHAAEPEDRGRPRRRDREVRTVIHSIRVPATAATVATRARDSRGYEIVIARSWRACYLWRLVAGSGSDEFNPTLNSSRPGVA